MLQPVTQTFQPYNFKIRDNILSDPLRPREVTSEFPVAQNIETHAANFHYSLFIILYYIIFCLSYCCIAGKSIISIPGCTQIITAIYTLSAATILSPLAMLGENKTAHGFKILCYANL